MPDNARPKVLVTGASGLIGFATLCDLRHDFQVVGFDQVCRPGTPMEVEAICFDIKDANSVAAALERVAYAYGKDVASVVHLAAYYRFSDEPHPLYQEVTVDGTRRLLEELKRQRFEVEQFLFASTMLAHAPAPPGQRISEESPLRGKWPYPQSKIETEQLVRELRGDIPAVMLRMAGVYTDRGQAPAIAHQIARVHQRSIKSHVYSGDTSRGQSYVHIEDLVRAIRLMVEHRRDLGQEEAFVIAEPETYSYDELQRVLGELLHEERDWKTVTVPKPVAKLGAWAEVKVADVLPGVEEPFIKPFMVEMADDHYEVDIKKAREELNWEPQHRLIDTLPSMVEALMQDPDRWYKAHKIKPPR